MDIDDILLEREKELKEVCNGKEISEASNALGFWWILSNQKISGGQGIYIFERAGYGRLVLRTDSKNIVTKTSYSM